MRQAIPMSGMLLLLAVCLFAAGCGRGDRRSDGTAASSEVATESETEAEIRTGAPASPGKRPGVDNNPVEPPKTPDSETEAPPTPSGPKTEPPGKGSREGNELPPLWVPAEGT